MSKNMVRGIAFANWDARIEEPIRKLNLCQTALTPLPLSRWERGGSVCGYIFVKRRMIVTPKEVLALCREKDVKAVDLRFMDFPGLWQHFTIPVDKLDEDTFEDGLGFDGSSIRGWQAINESDMLIVPQPDTATIDPFCALTTL